MQPQALHTFWIKKWEEEIIPVFLYLERKLTDLLPLAGAADQCAVVTWHQKHDMVTQLSEVSALDTPSASISSGCCTWTRRAHDSRRPTHTFIMRMCERQYPPTHCPHTPAGGGTLPVRQYLNFSVLPSLRLDKRHQTKYRSNSKYASHQDMCLPRWFHRECNGVDAVDLWGLGGTYPRMHFAAMTSSRPRVLGEYVFVNLPSWDKDKLAYFGIEKLYIIICSYSIV